MSISWEQPTSNAQALWEGKGLFLLFQSQTLWKCHFNFRTSSRIGWGLSYNCITFQVLPGPILPSNFAGIFFFQNTLPNKTHACKTLSHRVSRVYESLPKGFWRILPTTQWNLVLLCSDIAYIILKVVPRPQNILNKYIIFSKQNQQWLC